MFREMIASLNMFRQIWCWNSTTKTHQSQLFTGSVFPANIKPGTPPAAAKSTKVRHSHSFRKRLKQSGSVTTAWMVSHRGFWWHLSWNGWQGGSKLKGGKPANVSSSLCSFVDNKGRLPQCRLWNGWFANDVYLFLCNIASWIDIFHDLTGMNACAFWNL